jgi:hypothetical protein
MQEPHPGPRRRSGVNTAYMQVNGESDNNDERRAYICMALAFIYRYVATHHARTQKGETAYVPCLCVVFPGLASVPVRVPLCTCQIELMGGVQGASDGGNIGQVLYVIYYMATSASG